MKLFQNSLFFYLNFFCFIEINKSLEDSFTSSSSSSSSFTSFPSSYSSLLSSLSSSSLSSSSCSENLSFYLQNKEFCLKSSYLFSINSLIYEKETVFKSLKSIKLLPPSIELITDNYFLLYENFIVSKKPFKGKMTRSVSLSIKECSQANQMERNQITNDYPIKYCSSEVTNTFSHSSFLFFPSYFLSLFLTLFLSFSLF